MSAPHHVEHRAEPTFDPDERASYVARRAAEVRRLRGLLASTSLQKLASITHLEPYGEPGHASWTRLRQAAVVAGDLARHDEHERTILVAIAMHHAAQQPPIFSHGTVRAILDLPSIGRSPQLVECVKPPGGSGRSPQARRRRTSIVPARLSVDELLVTTIDRTVIDSARERSLESAVTTADAAGFIGRVDFFWRQLGIIGEADGRMKFRVADGLSGRQAEEAVWRAKRRDDHGRCFADRPTRRLNDREE